MSISGTTQTRELQELVHRSGELRNVFAQTSAQVDALGEDPGDNLRQIA